MNNRLTCSMGSANDVGIRPVEVSELTGSMQGT
jgi:hypothetical protein